MNKIIEALTQDINEAAHASGSASLARLSNCLEILRDGIILHKLSRIENTAIAHRLATARGGDLCLQRVRQLAAWIPGTLDALIDSIVVGIPRADMALLTQYVDTIDDLVTACLARYFAVKDRIEGIVDRAMAHERDYEIAIARALARCE